MSSEPPSTIRRRRRLARFAVGLLAAWLLASGLGAWFVAHPITRPVRLPAALRALPVRDAAFASRDGVALSGWWVPSQDALGTVILAHGAFENRMAMADCVAPLRARGLNVLLFDFRARGRSGGRQSTLGKLETEDLLGAVDWVLAQPEAAGRPVGLQGYSMGAAAALMAAARDPRVAAVVADSPYASLDRAETRHLRTICLGPCSPVLGWPTRQIGRRLMGFDPATVSPLAAVGRIPPRPLLLIHGTRDWMTDPADSRALAQAASSATLWEVPGARHTKARKRVREEYWRRVGAFWEQSLGAAAGSVPLGQNEGGRQP